MTVASSNGSDNLTAVGTGEVRSTLRSEETASLSSNTANLEGQSGAAETVENIYREGAGRTEGIESALAGAGSSALREEGRLDATANAVGTVENIYREGAGTLRSNTANLEALKNAGGTGAAATDNTRAVVAASLTGTAEGLGGATLATLTPVGPRTEALEAALRAANDPNRQFTSTLGGPTTGNVVNKSIGQGVTPG